VAASASWSFVLRPGISCFVARSLASAVVRSLGQGGAADSLKAVADVDADVPALGSELYAALSEQALTELS